MVKPLKWSDEETQYLLELVEKYGKKWTIIAQKLEEKYKKPFSDGKVRKRYNRIQATKRIEEQDEWEILSDGSYRSRKLIWLNSQQEKDPVALLKAHGFDPNEWDLISAKNKMWNVYSKIDKTQVQYSSTITVKPKRQDFDQYVLERIIDRLPNVEVPKNTPEPVNEEPYLNIPLFDMHFGPADYDFYKQTQARILHYLEKPRKDVLFIVGQDLFHNNDFQGHTASGRDIEKVDMEKAFEDAWKFYVPLIEAAIQNSEQVHVYYSIGNHDEYAAWSFVKALEKRYGEQARFDTRFKERKVHMLGRNFIGMNHSDKKKMQRLPENFAVEFPELWAKATTREVFTGHDHKEEVITIVSDYGGIVLRKMPTGNRTDDWHDAMGYTTAHKRFQIFFYDETRVVGSAYV